MFFLFSTIRDSLLFSKSFICQEVIFFEIILFGHDCISWRLPQWLNSKETIHNAGAEGGVGAVPGLGRSPEVRNGNPVFLPGESHGQRSLRPSPKGLQRVGHDWATERSISWICDLLFFFTILENFRYYLFTHCFCSILYPSTTLITCTWDLFTVSHMSPMLFSAISHIFYFFFLWKSLSRVLLFVTPWTVARQTPLSVESSRQEYWNGEPVPFSRRFRQPRDWTQVSHISGDPLSSEPWRKSALMF